MDIHLAINPTADAFSGLPIFPNEAENTIIEKLKNCHRNSLEIALLMLHLNVYNSFSSSLSNEDNLPLHKTCLIVNSRSLWIIVGEGISNEAILEAIKTEVGSSLEDVALLYPITNPHFILRPSTKI